ncbi:hypothetical protein PV08_03219 [Exophiala spinifera]|uniref:NAD(P)-binding protein n=1 Tax=Exophiala spinifera TaxID=91928 RepID=A0A0D2BK30_9EURO|nr:uncharacterized protein PV08_03219 [Exophiala spinifera]KIW18930.1 hypothetical protein PV08_03219 [Exophiala spinifera]
MSPFSKSVLITGGTTGLGFHAATEIARRYPNYQVVIAARKDADKSADAINTKLGQDNVRFMPLDLADLKNIRAFVKSWEEKRYPPVAHLLLNAALQFPDDVKYTADGVEATFGITVVGHALLFHLLQPHLSADARIVVTSSGTHDPEQRSGLPDARYDTAERLAHPAGASLKYEGRQRYATAKLCNILWTYALHRRILALNKKWTVVAFDPGLMPGTGLAREAGPLLRFAWSYVLPRAVPILRRVYHHNIHRPQESGSNLAWVATAERGTSGVYYEIRKPIKSSVDSYKEEKQDDLWNWMVGFLAATDEERQEFNTLSVGSRGA